MESISQATAGAAGLPLGALRGTLPGALATPTELFEQEVARAVQRQGGARAVEARASEADSARRGARHSTFDDYRTGQEDRRRGPDSDETSPDRVPTAPQAEPSRRPDPGGGTGASTQVRPDETGRRPDPGQNRSGEAGAGESGPAGVAAAAGLPGAAPAGIGAPTPPSGSVPVAAPSTVPAARPQTPLVAFGQAAEPPQAEKAVAAGVRAPGAGPDPSLVEHAAEVLRQIKLSLSQGARRVSVDLEPRDLGRLSIRLTVRDGRLAAEIRAASPQTLELLERQAPELRAALALQGFDPDHIDLDLGPGGERHGWDHESADPPARDVRVAVGGISDTTERPRALLTTPDAGPGIDTYA